FHFNPKVRPDLIFDSFCFEPANIYEKRVGSLYMAGILRNTLPQNARFLDHLAKVIRERYYKFTLKTPEKALKESLKSTNEFLEQVAKKGDVSWLGNLSFATLSLKNFELNFTKVGEIKILLLRKGQIIDIDKRLKFQDLEPYPLKVFPNIVSGKLAENDIILILTKDVFNAFQSQNILSKMAETFSDGLLDGKQIKDLLQKKTAELSKIFGTCLLVYLSEEETAPSRQVISPKIKTPPREFSLKAVFSPFLINFQKIFRKPNISFRLALPRLAWKGKKNTFKLPRLTWPRLKFPAPLLRNRNLILVLALIAFLGFGSLVSKGEENQKLNSHKVKFAQIQEKTDNAENILTLNKNNPAIKKQATDLLNEAWGEISSLVKITSTSPKDFRTQILSLRDEISSNLFELNKMVRLDNPEMIAEVDSEQIIPQKIISGDKGIYLFSPYSQSLVRISKDQKPENVQRGNGEKFNSAARLPNNSLVFFSKPNKISVLEDTGFSETDLSGPSWDFSFDQLAVFNSNLYFFDKKTGKIIKYSYAGGLKWGEPEDWTQNKSSIEVESMAVDGSIWILNKDYTLSRLYAGRVQETLKIDIFPQAKDFSKILINPSLPYIYILEPGRSRVVILNKSGKIVKQFQSDKFNNLLDFSVSADGKIIYLLSGQKVYQIKTSD
ncbi:MAG: hypothetical protein Q7S70_01130, partial [bacterium]|nr:hypothetical protein [bacterium]